MRRPPRARKVRPRNLRLPPQDPDDPPRDLGDRPRLLSLPPRDLGDRTRPLSLSPRSPVLPPRDRKAPDLGAEVSPRILDGQELGADAPDLGAIPPDLEARPPPLEARLPDLEARVPPRGARCPDLEAKPSHLGARPPDLEAQPSDLEAGPPDPEARPSDLEGCTRHPNRTSSSWGDRSRLLGDLLGTQDIAESGGATVSPRGCCDKITAQLRLQIALDRAKDKEPFEALPRAPQKFWDLYSTGRTSEENLLIRASWRGMLSQAWRGRARAQVKLALATV